MTRTAAPAQTTGSAIVAALEAAWADIQVRVVDLPDVVFITGTGLMGRGAKWGHYRRHGWALRGQCPDGCAVAHEDTAAMVRFHEDGRKPEVFIAGERLATGAQDTLQTMLHEAAHALAAVRDVADTSKEGRYHNRRFLAIAEELGLEFTGDPDATIGYSAVTITDEAAKAYARTVKRLGGAIRVYLDTFAGLSFAGTPGGSAAGAGGSGGGAPRGGRGKSRNNPKAVCGCEVPRIIRASAKVLADGPIICGVCREEFRAVETDEDGD